MNKNFVQLQMQRRRQEA